VGLSDEADTWTAGFSEEWCSDVDPEKCAYEDPLMFETLTNFLSLERLFESWVGCVCICGASTSEESFCA